MTINEFTGLSAAFDPAKSPALSSARNVRYRDGVPRPTKAHVKLERPSSGRMQAIFVAGNILGVVQGGTAYYRNLSDEVWQPIANWTPMASGVPRVWVTPVSAQSNYTNMEVLGSAVTSNPFNAGMVRYPRVLVVQDGINQPNLIYDNGTSTVAGTYDLWTKQNPNYIPVGKFGAFTGSKHYVTNGTKVFHSVSGRPTDFVVNLTATGDKGGDADSWCFVPAYNELTAIIGSPDGNLLCATLYSMHMLVVQETTRFGEPLLWPTELFPIGAVNDVCFTNVKGSIAFVSQTGIHTFNEGSQLRQDSNNNALSASIRQLMAPVQSSNAAAIRFDDYALFAVDTVYGRGIVAYDTQTEVFVSIDDCPADLKQFGLYKVDGVERLFFITDDDIYEAYAGESSQATLQYGPYVGNKDHITSGVEIMLRDIAGGEVTLSVFDDNVVEPLYVGKANMTRQFDVAEFAYSNLAGRALCYVIGWTKGGILSMDLAISPSSATVVSSDGELLVREKYLLLGVFLSSQNVISALTVFDAQGLFLLDYKLDDLVVDLGSGEEVATVSPNATCAYLKGTPGAPVTSTAYFVRELATLLAKFHSANVLAVGQLVPAVGKWMIEKFNINLRTGATSTDLTPEFWNQVARRPAAYHEHTDLLQFEYIDPLVDYTATSLQAKRHKIRPALGELMTVVFAPEPVVSDSIYGDSAALAWDWRDDVGLILQPLAASELIQKDNRMHVGTGTLVASFDPSSTAGRADIYATKTGYWTLEVTAAGGTLAAYDLAHQLLYTHHFGRRGQAGSQPS